MRQQTQLVRDEFLGERQMEFLGVPAGHYVRLVLEVSSCLC